MSTSPTNLRTSAQLAAELSVTKVAVNRLARENGIGTFIGQMRVFAPADVRKLKQLCMGKRGNPNLTRKQP